MAAARSERYLDHGRAREEPSGCAISGLSRVVHAAGHQLAAEQLRTPRHPGRCREFRSTIDRIQAPSSSLRLVRPDRERADRDDVAIAVALDAIGERVVDRVLFGGRLQSPVPAVRRRRPRPRSSRSAHRRAGARRRRAHRPRSPDCRRPGRSRSTFSVVGTGTTKTSSTATIMQGTPAIAPHDFERPAHGFVDACPARCRKRTARPDRARSPWSCAPAHNCSRASSCRHRAISGTSLADERLLGRQDRA